MAHELDLVRRHEAALENDVCDEISVAGVGPWISGAGVRGLFVAADEPEVGLVGVHRGLHYRSPR